MAILIPAAIAAATNVLGGMAAGSAAESAANKAASLTRQQAEEALRRLEAIGIPTVEAQKIVLETPELVGELLAEQLGQTEMANIKTDPRYKQAQLDALMQLRNLSDQGLSTEDLMLRDQFLDQESNRLRSEQQAVLQNMQERGTLDSGAQLAAQLSNMQGSAARGQDAALQLANQRAQARQAAIQNLAQTSGNLQQQEFGQQSQVASAKDRIAEMNAQARQGASQFNIQNKQNVANQASNIRNQQEMYNKNLLQQDYQNKLQKEGIARGIGSNQAQTEANMALAKGQGQANMYSNIGSALGNIATAFGTKK